jgi:acetate kinase
MHTQDAAHNQTILVLNSGSSSLKFGLFSPSGDDESLLLEGRYWRALRIHPMARAAASQTDALQKRRCSARFARWGIGSMAVAKISHRRGSAKDRILRRCISIDER